MPLTATEKQSAKNQNLALSLTRQAKAIKAKADAEGRELTAEENAQIDSLLDAKDALIGEDGFGRKTFAGSPLNENTKRAAKTTAVETWLSKDGKPVPVLSNKMSLAGYLTSAGALPQPKSDAPLSLGNLIRSIVTGDKSLAEAEQLEMMAVDMGGSAATGGLLIPGQIFAPIIDASRARAVVMAAGAMTVPMETAGLSIARVKTDPTFETKEQNAAFTGSSVAFDAVQLTARTIGTIVTMSAELAADAPNAGTLIDQVLANALAAEIDRLAIQGNAGQPTGILNEQGTTETTSVGGITWEDYLGAIEAIELVNGEPNAYVVNPAIKKDLDALTSGDGTNSAKLWLPPPAGVAALQRYVTTNIPLASSIVGDFTKLLMGVRQSATIQVSNIAGDTFSKNQVAVRIVWRGDFALVRANHFHCLRGITS